MKPYIQKPFFYFVAACILNACNAPSSVNEPEGRDAAPLERHAADSLTYELSYAGVFPCKDCAGIKTTLRLSPKKNTFSLTEEFLKTDIAPNKLSGSYNTERGFEKDANATVYILNDTLPVSEQIFFLRETGKDSILLRLDNSRQKTGHTNFVVRKIQE